MTSRSITLEAIQQDITSAGSKTSVFIQDDLPSIAGSTNFAETQGLLESIQSRLDRCYDYMDELIHPEYRTSLSARTRGPSGWDEGTVRALIYTELERSAQEIDWLQYPFAGKSASARSARKSARKIRRLVQDARQAPPGSRA